MNKEEKELFLKQLHEIIIKADYKIIRIGEEVVENEQVVGIAKILRNDREKPDDYEPDNRNTYYINRYSSPVEHSGMERRFIVNIETLIDDE